MSPDLSHPSEWEGFSRYKIKYIYLYIINVFNMFYFILILEREN